MRKPRIFIASSAESITVADAVNVNLDHEFEVTIWKNGTFKLSSSVLPDLIQKTSHVDFALFIFTPDDLTEIRGTEYTTVRDNVIFELGLFIGAIGRERSFIIMPRGEKLRLPSDLIGITTADYDPNRTDGDLTSATNRACTLIKTEVNKLGLINRESLSTSTRIVANPIEYELCDIDFSVLTACLQSRTTRPEGITFFEIEESLGNINEQQLQLSSLKLQRMGLVEIEIETHQQNDYDYLAYSVTELGVDILLENEFKANI